MTDTTVIYIKTHELNSEKETILNILTDAIMQSHKQSFNPSVALHRNYIF